VLPTKEELDDLAIAQALQAEEDEIAIEQQKATQTTVFPFEFIHPQHQANEDEEQEDDEDDKLGEISTTEYARKFENHVLAVNHAGIPLSEEAENPRTYNMVIHESFLDSVIQNERQHLDKAVAIDRNGGVADYVPKRKPVNLSDDDDDNDNDNDNDNDYQDDNNENDQNNNEKNNDNNVGEEDRLARALNRAAISTAKPNHEKLRINRQTKKDDLHITIIRYNNKQDRKLLVCQKSMNVNAILKKASQKFKVAGKQKFEHLLTEDGQEVTDSKKITNGAVFIVAAKHKQSQPPIEQPLKSQPLETQQPIEQN